MALFNPRLKPYFIIIAVIVAIDVILVVSWAVSFKKFVAIKSEINTIKQSLKTGKHSAVNLKELAEMERTHHIAATKLEFLESFFKVNQANVKSYSQNPLLFKQRLSEMQEILQKEAIESNFPVPKELGFEKYNINVPDEADLPLLNRQLDIITQIVRLMMESKMYRLEKIEFKQAKTSTDELKNIQVNELPLNITFSCREKDLFKFLYSLRTCQEVYILDSMAIDKVSNTDSVQVSLSIIGIMF